MGSRFLGSGGDDAIAIERATFLEVLTKKAVADFASPEKELLSSFEALDADGSGTISKAELFATVGNMCADGPCDAVLDLDGAELHLPEAFEAFARRSGTPLAYMNVFCLCRALSLLLQARLCRDCTEIVPRLYRDCALSLLLQAQSYKLQLEVRS